MLLTAERVHDVQEETHHEQRVTLHIYRYLRGYDGQRSLTYQPVRDVHRTDPTRPGMTGAEDHEGWYLADLRPMAHRVADPDPGLIEALIEESMCTED